MKKLMLFSVSTLILTACSGGSSGNRNTGDVKNPEIQKPALKVTKEIETCSFEGTDFLKDNDGDSYYMFSRSSHQVVRKVSYYENNVKRQITDSQTQRSTCFSYQDHCNQTWSSDKLKMSSDVIVRSTNQANGIRQEFTEGAMTITLIETTDQDQSELNQPENRSVLSTTLERVKGNKRFLIQDTTNGFTINYNENLVTELAESETSRIENLILLKPIQFSDEDGTTTILKWSGGCTTQIQPFFETLSKG